MNSMMVCPRCGNVFAEDICPQCGYDSRSFRQEMEKAEMNDSVADSLEEMETEPVSEKETEVNVESGSPETDQKKTDKKKTNTILLVIAGLILIVTLGYILKKYFDSQYIANAYKGELQEIEVDTLEGEIPEGWVADEENVDDYKIYFSENEEAKATLTIRHLYEVDYLDDFNDTTEYVDEMMSATRKDVTLSMESYGEDTEIEGAKAQYVIYSGQSENKKEKLWRYTIHTDHSFFVVIFDAEEGFYQEEDIHTVLDHINFADYKTPEISGITVEYSGSKEAGTMMTAEYLEDIAGLTVNAVFDNYTMDITEDCEIKGDKVLTADKTSHYKVSYTYNTGETFTEEFDVECDTKTTKLTAEYVGSTEDGKKIKTDNKWLTVTAYYSNDTSEVLKKDFTIEGNNKLEAGETSKMTIKYHGKKCELKVKCTTVKTSIVESFVEQYNSLSNQLVVASNGSRVEYGKISVEDFDKEKNEFDLGDGSYIALIDDEKDRDRLASVRYTTGIDDDDVRSARLVGIAKGVEKEGTDYAIKTTNEFTDYMNSNVSEMSVEKTIDGYKFSRTYFGGNVMYFVENK